MPASPTSGAPGRFRSRWRQARLLTENCNLHTFVDYCTEGKCLATDSCPSSSVKQVAVLDFERTEYFREGVRIGSITTDSAKNPDSMFHLIEMKRAIGLEPTPTASGGDLPGGHRLSGPCRHDAGDPDHPAVALMIPMIPTTSPSVDDPSGGFGDVNLPEDPTSVSASPNGASGPGVDPSGGFGDAGMWAQSVQSKLRQRRKIIAYTAQTGTPVWGCCYR